VSNRVVILRPEPGASATANKAISLGLAPIIAPLFEVGPLDWAPPDAAQFDAIMMTSANAARHGDADLVHYIRLPLYAVGSATAAAAAKAGFTDVRVGDGDAASLLHQIARDDVQHVLHFAGQDVVETSHPDVIVTLCVVYAAHAIDPPPRLPPDTIILVHSPRAGARLATLIPHDHRHRYAILAISRAARDATGEGWDAIYHAEQPNDDALLARAAALCKLT
jgi:uroporphyrinogen-III synthase